MNYEERCREAARALDLQQQKERRLLDERMRDETKLFAPLKSIRRKRCACHLAIGTWLMLVVSLISSAGYLYTAVNHSVDTYRTTLAALTLAKKDAVHLRDTACAAQERKCEFHTTYLNCPEICASSERDPVSEATDKAILHLLDHCSLVSVAGLCDPDVDKESCRNSFRFVMQFFHQMSETRMLVLGGVVIVFMLMVLPALLHLLTVRSLSKRLQRDQGMLESSQLSADMQNRIQETVKTLEDSFASASNTLREKDDMYNVPLANETEMNTFNMAPRPFQAQEMKRNSSYVQNIPFHVQVRSKDV